MLAADDMKDVSGELSDISVMQPSCTEMVSAQLDQTEAILDARARNNLHFILCISPVSPAQMYRPTSCTDTRIGPFCR